MRKPLHSLISKILKVAPSFSFLRIAQNGNETHLSVVLKSASSYMSLKEDVELPIVRQSRFGEQYLLEWDVPSNMFEDRKLKPYCFSKDNKETRKKVNSQEEDAANMIGGRRHIGSGSIPGIKSDASGDTWQVEAKMAVKRKSISLSVDRLSKITYEASVSGKKPMMYLTYENIPNDVRMEDTWVVIPRSEFERMQSRTC